jgi:hypothetical protein
MRALALLATAAGLVVAAAMPAQEAAREGTDKLKPPPGNVVLLKVHARGVQDYVSKALPTKADLFEWVPTPRATLFDFADKGKKVGKHYGGPTWEAADGSKVVGALPPVAAVLKEGAVPWLLIRAKSHEGSGIFGKVTYIQRVDTRGGVPPALRPTRADLKSPVEYTATYVFYGLAP